MATINNNVEIRVTTKGVDQSQAGLKKLASTAAGMVATYLSVSKAIKTAFQSAEVYNEAVKTQKILEAQIKTTGKAAGFTAMQFREMASALSKKSDFSTGEILKDLITPLTSFKSIAGDTFERLQEAALNMATVMQTDLRSAAIQLGKAFQDPQRGLMMLSRSGVSFTETERNMIKAMAENNNLLGAQQYILKALEGQFGNAAQAGQTAAGELKKAWKGYLVYMGTETAPVINGVKSGIALALRSMTKNTNTFTTNAIIANLEIERSWSKMVGKVVRFVSIIGEAIGNVVVTIGDLIGAMFKYYKALDDFSIFSPKKSIDGVIASFKGVTTSIKESIGFWGQWGDEAVSSLSTVDYEANKYYNNQIEAVKKNQDIALKAFDDPGGDGGFAKTADAAKETAESIKQLSADIKEYLSVMTRAGEAETKFSNDLANRWQAAQDLIDRSKKLGQDITALTEAQRIDQENANRQYYEESLNAMKNMGMSEKELINKEYNDKLTAFDQYAAVARQANDGLFVYKLITAEEYQKNAAEIEALGVKVLRDATNDKTKATIDGLNAQAAALQSQLDILLENSNAEFAILQDLGMTYDQYVSHRQVQIGHEKQALLDKKVQIEFINAWEKQQLEKMAEEYKKYIESTQKYQESFAGQMDELGKRVKESIASGFGTAFADAIVEGENFFTAMQKLFKDLVKMILAELAKIAILAAFKSIFGIASEGGGIVGGVVSAVTGKTNSIDRGIYQQSTPSYMTPILNTNSIDRRLDRLAQAIENNRPQVYTQVIKGVPFYNAVKQATLEANAL